MLPALPTLSAISFLSELGRNSEFAGRNRPSLLPSRSCFGFHFLGWRGSLSHRPRGLFPFRTRTLRARLHPIAVGHNFPAQQFPQRRHIAFVVARLINGRFKNKRTPRQQRVIQNPPKRFKSDFSLPD